MADDIIRFELKLTKDEDEKARTIAERRGRLSRAALFRALLAAEWAREVEREKRVA